MVIGYGRTWEGDRTVGYKHPQPMDRFGRGIAIVQKFLSIYDEACPKARMLHTCLFAVRDCELNTSQRKAINKCIANSS